MLAASSWQVMRTVARAELAARAASVPAALRELPRDTRPAHPLDAEGLSAHLAVHELASLPPRLPG